MYIKREERVKEREKKMKKLKKENYYVIDVILEEFKGSH